ncbi:MAG: TetR/AcrR family transcriptional regulator [Candidatus Dormibacteraceae bacterium]
MTRGRPKDAEAAQAAILEAAEANFAEQGFAGARVDLIAHLSGYNKSLIFHYFGDKLGLYTAVLQRADQQGQYLNAYIFEMLAVDLDLTADAVRRFIERMAGATFDYFITHPRVLRILAWEEAEGWTTLAKVSSRLDQSDVGLFNAFVDRAQRAGALRPNLSPRLVLHVIFNTCRSYFTSVQLFDLIAPEDGSVTEDRLASAREQIAAFVTHGLIADDPSPAGDRPAPAVETRPVQAR